MTTRPSGWSWAKEYASALRYISSPTMGLPGGRDALDYVDEASEANVRACLKACIRTARQALAEPARNDHPAKCRCGQPLPVGSWLCEACNV